MEIKVSIVSTEAHTWTEVGTYTIKVKARKAHDVQIV
jgi:hypothetical protein